MKAARICCMVLLIAAVPQSIASGSATWVTDRGGRLDTEAGRIVGVHLGSIGSPMPNLSRLQR